MSERTDADRLADRLLDEPNADSDDDLRVLSRQLLRRNEVIDKLTKELTDQQDPTRDMIEANRDSILRIHEDGLRRISKIVMKYTDADGGHNAIGAMDCLLLVKIINAVNSFHPMHGESWSGWPE